MAGRQCGRVERTTGDDLAAWLPDVPLLKSRESHQVMSKLPSRFVIGFKHFESCSNQTDPNTFSGSGGTACNHGVKLPRFQSWLYHIVLTICSEDLCASIFSYVKWASKGCFEVYKEYSIKVMST